MKKEFSFIFILALIIVAAIFLRPVYGWSLRALFAPAISQTISQSEIAAENQSLKAELSKLQFISDQLPQRPAKNIRALIYSRYPFNFKNELLINAGAREKVSKGKAVTVNGILIGKVNEVFEETSLVQTVFDDQFQLAVKIGKEGSQALLKGGSLPTLQLIAPTAKIQQGDSVYSNAPDIPFGLPIGEVKEVRVSDDKLFQTATFDIVYDIGSIGTVFVAQ